MEKVKNLMATIFGLIFYLIGIASLIFGAVYQFVLSYKRFGAIITRNIFIPHWSAWFFLVAIISVVIGQLLFMVEGKEKE